MTAFNAKDYSVRKTNRSKNEVRPAVFCSPESLVALEYSRCGFLDGAEFGEFTAMPLSPNSENKVKTKTMRRRVSLAPVSRLRKDLVFDKCQVVTRGKDVPKIENYSHGSTEKLVLDTHKNSSRKVGRCHSCNTGNKYAEPSSASRRKTTQHSGYDPGRTSIEASLVETLKLKVKEKKQLYQCPDDLSRFNPSPISMKNLASSSDFPSSAFLGRNADRSSYSRQ
jgi:hypothetical protein